MIGYYVHHQGLGHMHRALTVAGHLDADVTGLSSLDRPRGWRGDWVLLERDDTDSFPVDAFARGHLHWVPERSAGLRSRMARVSAWIEQAHPDLMVVDVSVEVALLARLHGLPVITTVLPGSRADPPHVLVHGIARRIVAAWPADVQGMLDGIDADDPRLAHVGAVSRFDQRIEAAGGPKEGGHRVALLMGRGGAGLDPEDVVSAQASSPDWRWTVVGADEASWTDDPWQVLLESDVVVTHAGQNALAEVAAARRPAVVIPGDRPYGEQRATAAALRNDGRFPAVALESFPTSGWSHLLGLAARLDGQLWRGWNDGSGAERMAAVIQQEIGR